VYSEYSLFHSGHEFLFFYRTKDKFVGVERGVMVGDLFAGDNHDNWKLKILALVNESMGLCRPDGFQVHEDRLRARRVIGLF
jgi:hypothetical protein